MRTITIIKRSISVNGKRTSVSLENEFWQSLHEIAKKEGRSTTELVEQINRERRNPNLSSAIRVFVIGKGGQLPFPKTARPLLAQSGHR